MIFTDLIKKKRDGHELTRDELHELVVGAVNTTIPDYQLSAFLMAVRLNKMTVNETAMLTNEMASSGEMVDLSCFGSLSADKHSTGGIGDKTTLIVAPTVAALGGKVAKMSGRALGHTGGTIDKLESIPGYRCELSASEMIEQVNNIGLAVISQNADLAPADKIFYALRDVTATVDSPSLIASSIMSKKLACGAQNIVLDVKFGNGAFLKTKSEAYELAKLMVDIGHQNSKNVRAVISDMNDPLGFSVGNALEVKEAIDVLRGNGPSDLRQLSITLSGLLISMVRGISVDDGIKLSEETLASGKSFEKFLEWISAQGGDTRYILAPELFGEASVKSQITANSDGYISSINSEALGNACVLLGGGRSKKDDHIDSLAGIVLNKKTGDRVARGDIIATLHTSTPEKASYANELLKDAFTISSIKPKNIHIIPDII